MPSLFPRDVLDEIWDSTESVSGGLPTSVRDTSSNDTSSTATLRRKFLSNYQFGEKQLRRMHFRRIRHLVEFLPWSKYLVDYMFCSILFCIYILSDLKVGSWSLE